MGTDNHSVYCLEASDNSQQKAWPLLGGREHIHLWRAALWRRHTPTTLHLQEPGPGPALALWKELDPEQWASPQWRYPPCSLGMCADDDGGSVVRCPQEGAACVATTHAAVHPEKIYILSAQAPPIKHKSHLPKKGSTHRTQAPPTPE